LIQIRLEEDFEAYLIGTLLQQLESILNETNNFKPVLNNFGQASKSSTAAAFIPYDCESYTEKELFKYLYQVWK
jgi:hypothetical protein